jgi:hypothetical protein
MSEEDVAIAPKEVSRRPRSEIEVFVIKAAAILGACLIFVFAVFNYLESRIEDATALLKGGPDFWTAAEKKLYEFANAKDLPEEKKARIVSALQKISAKYGPFIEALTPPPKK